MKKSFLTAMLASTILAAGAAAPAALAQQEGATMQQPAPVGSADVTDEQIRSYITAAQGVGMIAQSYQPQLEAAEDQETAMAIQQEAEQQMIAVVEQAGLTVDEYNAIVAGSQSDPELAERINAEAATMTGQPQ
ncbi:MAG: DUF4168 domain-containing protein [Oceanicaulis sp.]|uniref:DUF4168 domain-containing protein n=1 Tax=Glycocaulis sp. TaxID=1969725 RepID=UPI0025C5FF1D|nr:DUF4168 domain-containing protein [Glycocaulis sp.]MCC5982490.1 DUF4168 domain-containing protein [Oceanicaulis sp.]MCH8521544.1 DUF4168 domain-containing protein [Glycocaulis sp.]